MTQPVGTIQTIFRHPVKSMLGETLESARVTEQGLEGDRAFGLIDKETGKLASAKLPLKWGQLFHIESKLLGSGEIEFLFQDGSTATSSDANIEERLAKAVGREVKLSGSAVSSKQIDVELTGHEGIGDSGKVLDFELPGTADAERFFDSGVFNVLTTAALKKLGELYPEGNFDARRFRPNLVVDTGEESGFPEDNWIGRRLKIGSELEIEVVEATGRCVMTTLDQPGLAKDPGIMKAIVEHHSLPHPRRDVLAPSVGVHTKIVTPGVIRVGDVVEILDLKYLTPR